MPTLNRIGTEAVVKHHKKVPLRLLEQVPDLSCGNSENRNLIVGGDNLRALKALLQRYAGHRKCGYTAPPYNTVNEGWVYNDRINRPETRWWLGEVVGKQGESQLVSVTHERTVAFARSEALLQERKVRWPTH